MIDLNENLENKRKSFVQCVTIFSKTDMKLIEIKKKNVDLLMTSLSFYWLFEIIVNVEINSNLHGHGKHSSS